MNPYQPLRNVDVGSHVVSTHGSRGGKTPHQQPNSFVCARLCEDVFVLCVLYDSSYVDITMKRNRNDLKLLTVDILALATMKNAAKCDT